MKSLGKLLLPLALANVLGNLPALAAPAKFGAVNVAGVSIRNLTREEATRRLKRELAPRLKRRVRLAEGRTAVAASRAHWGASLDVNRMLARAERGEKYVPLLLQVNPHTLQAALRRVAPRFQRTRRDARPYLYRSRVRIAPDIPGRELNLGAAVPRVAKTLEQPSGKDTIQVPVRLHAATLTRERLRGVAAVTGSFTTRFNPGNVKRTHNMLVAIRAINGTLLSPGEVFSLNKAAGERTQARGYRTAIIFKNGYKVAGIGGGVSQVTGTLFNAALVAGLPIVTYQTHSRPVAYLPIGRDATVAWGGFDMKFRNSTGAPIYISYQRQGNSIVARLFGTKKTERVRIHVAAKTLGPRHKEAKLFRKFIGKRTRTELVGTSTYQWKDGEWED